MRRTALALIEYLKQPNLMYEIDGLDQIQASSGVAV
jgi:hypothetical protein